jgi:hypothetical protein
MAVQFYEYLATATANYGIRASDLGTKLAVAYGNKLRETKTACVGITLNQVFVDLFQQRDSFDTKMLDVGRFRPRLPATECRRTTTTSSGVFS